MKFRIAGDHPALPGHFPGRPIVPGVVILDHVQQAIERDHGAFAAPIKLAQVKFLQPLLPEQEAEIVLEPSARGWKFRVQRGDTLIASGDIAPA
ncbi:hypothetical protein [Solilutibacter silvestris]|uniref:FabA-like protein n=1 Tax=Solilutibacter silvestris TaxID=1645665 RepID=A0A2K1Q0N0_9GAMM|nr:hypothetical protein [Lysobacter silvestris]PNS08583.1 FabA-like protein [Lysobacter silvestris]